MCGFGVLGELQPCRLLGGLTGEADYTFSPCPPSPGLTVQKFFHITYLPHKSILKVDFAQISLEPRGGEEREGGSGMQLEHTALPCQVSLGCTPKQRRAAQQDEVCAPSADLV